MAKGLLGRLGSLFAKADGAALPAVTAEPMPAPGFEGPEALFGPSAPQTPVAPQTAGRQFDYPVAYNLGTAPRDAQTGGVTFDMLRNFADSYDLLRVVIETRKNQLAGLSWRIGPKKRGVNDDARCEMITNFLAFPDKVNDWDTWVRALLEEMLVIDAAAVYPRRNQAGGIFALELIDGATIRPLINSQGRSPLPPLPAYQQIIKGLRTADYSRDELLYLPRNVRVWKVYGYSPVEQIIMTVQIALRRQLHQLQFYTEGTAPDSMFTVPEGWTVDQISQFQTYFNSLMAGNTANRRNGIFLPYGVDTINLKEGALKDEFDEWLARIVCYAFDVSQQWAVKQMNRATSETAERQSQREGLEPAKKWIKNLVDRVIVQLFDWPDLEFKWSEDVELAAADQAKIDDMLVGKAQRTINEARMGRGEPPIEGGDEPLIFTAGGAIRLRDIVNPPTPETPVPTAKPDPAGDGNKSRTPVFDRVEKAVKGASNGDHAGPRGGRFEPRAEDVARLTKIWGGFLDHAGRACSDGCQGHDRIAKAEGDDKDDDDSDRDVADRLDRLIRDLPWGDVENATAEILKDAAADAGSQAAEQLAARASVSVGISLDMVDEPAAAWAEQHSAALVTMISDTTRQQIADLVAADMRGDIKSTELAEKIREAGAFSARRAELIAIHEATSAANEGQLMGWLQMRDLYGVKTRKAWVLGLESNHCALCEANAVLGPINLDEEWPSGDRAPPSHPHCFCWMDSVVVDDDEIAKANPYHDGRGRFTTAGGAGTGGGQRPSRHFAAERRSTVQFVRENEGKAGAAEAANRALSLGAFRQVAAARKLGHNLKGYEAGITGDKVRHILGNHGSQSEMLRGQMPVTRNDIGHVAEIFARGRMSPGNKANAIVFEHEIGGFRYQLVGRITPAHNAIRAVTLWKTKL